MNKGAFASHTLELERLSHLLWHYETVNQDQKAMLEYQQKQRDVYIHRIQEMEKFVKGLQRKITNLEQNVKFEKMAAEGIKKKSNTFEAEVFVAQEKGQHFQEKANVYEKQNEELLLQLQEERCHRLQLIHEKEMYMHKYQGEGEVIQKVEADNRLLAQQNLNNLQKIETLLSQNQSAMALIQGQSQEIMTLNQEVEYLKKNVMNVNRSLLREENNHATYHHHMDLMQQEISFLRKQLIMHNIPYGGGGNNGNASSEMKHTTEKSWSTFQPTKSSLENKISDEVNKITANRYQVSSFTNSKVFSDRNREATKPTSEEIIAAQQQQMLLESSAEYRKQQQQQQASQQSQSSQYEDKSKSMQDFNSNLSSTSTLPMGEEAMPDFEQEDRDMFGDAKFGSGINFHMPSTLSTADSMSFTTNPASQGSRNISPLATPHRLYRSPFDHAGNSAGNLLSLGSSQDLLKQTNLSVDSSSSTVATTNYFDSNERVEMLDWIRTVSRKESKKKAKRDLTKKTSHVEDDMMLMSASFNTMHSVKNVQKAYGDVPGNKSLKGIGGSNASLLSHKQGSLEKKSIYVGSGLHMKHNEELDHELKKLQSGSTKQILKKIIGDKEF